MAGHMSPLIDAPAPWKCKATVYTALLFPGKDQRPPSLCYDPLEASSFFATEAAGQHAGSGPGSIMVVRYSESPVGSYDELVILPGEMTYRKPGDDLKKPLRMAMRVTRIYVSQKQTMYNGRKNWNIPKHLANFEWSKLPDGGISVKVFPILPNTAPSTKISRPFFQMTFKSIPYMPSFPSSTNLFKAIGVDPSLVQPPLPVGDPATDVVGTDRWCRTKMTVGSWKTSIGWMDMRQDVAATQSEDDEHFENFWPGLGRWQIATKMDDANIIVPIGEY